MLFGLLLTLGVAVLSVALRSYQTALAQKLGALGILIASFLAVYFITGNAGWGVAGGGPLPFFSSLVKLSRTPTLPPAPEKRNVGDKTPSRNPMLLLPTRNRASSTVK